MAEKPPADPPRPKAAVLSVPKGRINWEAIWDEEIARKLRYESAAKRDEINRPKRRP